MFSRERTQPAAFVHCSVQSSALLSHGPLNE